MEGQRSVSENVYVLLQYHIKVKNRASCNILNTLIVAFFGDYIDENRTQPSKTQVFTCPCWPFHTEEVTGCKLMTNNIFVHTNELTR